MSRLKDIGTNVATLGIAWLLKKYVAKRLPRAVVEVLDAAAKGLDDQVPPAVREALEEIKRAQFDANTHALMRQIQESERRIAEALAKNDARLLASAREAYERGKKL